MLHALASDEILGFAAALIDDKEIEGRVEPAKSYPKADR